MSLVAPLLLSFFKLHTWPLLPDEIASRDVAYQQLRKPEIKTVSWYCSLA